MYSVYGRLKPIDEEKEIDVEQSRINHASSNMSLAEKIPSIFDIDETSSTEIVEDWAEETKLTATMENSATINEDDVYSSQTIKETKTFVIVGVMDPRDNEQISIYRAINEGIISQAQGIYKNPDTGESMPIPEAMNKGLILVEFVNESIEKGALKRGIITTTTTKETISYSVQSVTDPITGKQISVADAVSKGIIDQKSGRYINPITGESMSIADAIKHGFVEAVVSGETGKNNNIKSVTDPATGKELSFDEAVAKGIIDPKSGRYINPRTGETMSLADAVLKGFITQDKEPGLRSIRTVTNPVTGKEISYEDAVAKGIIDPHTGLYINPRTGEKMTLAEAAEKGLITQKVPKIKSVKNPVTGKEISYEDAVAKGIIDPNTGLYINPRTGEKMTIADAIKKGLITPELPNLKSITDPTTGKEISMEEAIAKGLIDPDTGMYIDPITGERMSILEAIDRGLVTEADEAKVSEAKMVIQGVKDPKTGRTLSLRQAIQKGIIDTENGLYRNPVTGETLTIEEAIKRGLIDARLADPVKDKSSPDILSVKMTEGTDDTDLIAPENVGGLHAQKQPMDTNHAIFSKLQDQINTNLPGVREETTGESMTVGEAFNRGVLKMDPVRIENNNGDKYTLAQAAVQGLLDKAAARDLLSALEPHSLAQLIESGQLDPKTGEYIDPVTGRRMSFGEAVKQGKVDPDTIFYDELPNHAIHSLSSAAENKKMNLENCKFVDPKTGKELSLAEAIEKRLLDPKVDADKIMKQVASLQALKNHMDTSIGGVINAQTNENMTVEGAVMYGVLDISRAEHLNFATEQTLPLPEAVEEDLIKPETAKEILHAMSNMSLGEALKKASIDPNSGKYVHPETKRRMPLKEAVEKGYLEPNSVFYVEPNTNTITSLGAATEEGKFNPASGKFKDPLTGLEVSIANAISKGIVNPDIDPSKFIKEKCSLQDLLDNNNRSMAKDLVFVGPDGREMPIEEAIANGFLSPNSQVYIDPATGKVYAVGNEDILKSLMAVKESTDWLGGLEADVASRGHLSEDVGQLQAQMKQHEVRI